MFKKPACEFQYELLTSQRTWPTLERNLEYFVKSFVKSTVSLNFLLVPLLTQLMENAEINNIVKIVGLQYGKKYRSIDDMKSLRYGRLMIMTDQDQDGSHIKGLLINFIHHNWPDLLRLPFLEEFITPIVKVLFSFDYLYVMYAVLRSSNDTNT